MFGRPRSASLRYFAVAAYVAGIALLAIGLLSIGGRGTASRFGTRAVEATATGALPSTMATEEAAVGATPSSATTAAYAAQVASNAVAPTSADVNTPPASSDSTPDAPSLEAYRGLGSWIDIYDGRAWNNPAATVRDMSRHGVRTLFIETGNFHSGPPIHRPRALAKFIREAHARDMRVVAWYLPSMKHVGTDHKRALAAVRFRTSDGQTFDSFALDIESNAVASIKVRNAALKKLSKRIRASVGPAYPLGAIIPNVVSLNLGSRGIWPSFPYATVARYYDVLLPMEYYTANGGGASAARADAAANMRTLGKQKSCSKMPVHLIGGLAEDSSPSEVRAFVRVTQRTKCIGASMYGWVGTTSGQWKQLKAVR